MKAKYLTQVCQLLTYTELEYTSLVCEQGWKWLVLNDAAWLFEEEKAFWDWWKTQWNNRDRVYLEDIGNAYLSKEKLRSLYLKRNDASQLMHIFPQSCTIQESYKKFTTKVVRKGVHHG